MHMIREKAQRLSNCMTALREQWRAAGDLDSHFHSFVPHESMGRVFNFLAQGFSTTLLAEWEMNNRLTTDESSSIFYPVLFDLVCWLILP